MVPLYAMVDRASPMAGLARIAERLVAGLRQRFLRAPAAQALRRRIDIQQLALEVAHIDGIVDRVDLLRDRARATEAAKP